MRKDCTEEEESSRSKRLSNVGGFGSQVTDCGKTGMPPNQFRSYLR
jgi:hypothetical protein